MLISDVLAGLFVIFEGDIMVGDVVQIETTRGRVTDITMRTIKLMNEKRKIVDLDAKFTRRSVNEGFSGGEKKRNEIFQMAMLEPSLSILDETDSGLDVDAMRIVAEGVNKLRKPDSSCIVIPHYDRLLEMIRPDVVHVLYQGRIVKTAGPELAKEIQERGYDWIKTPTP